MTDGFDVLVQDVLERDARGLGDRGRALRRVVVLVHRVLVLRLELARVGRREAHGRREVDDVVVDLRVVVEVALELRLGVGQLDAVLRALRAGDGRDDRGEVELQVLAE
jgi:hypothetical protein